MISQLSWLKVLVVFSLNYVYINRNKCIKDGEYVEDFKKVEVRPLYKKDGRKENSNYRPVSIISNVSKFVKRCLHGQIYDFFENLIF